MKWVADFLRRLPGLGAPAAGRVEPVGPTSPVRESATIGQAIREAGGTCTIGGDEAAKPDQAPPRSLSYASSEDVDRRFIAFLLGAASPSAMQEREGGRRAIEQIEGLIASNRGASLVPRLQLELPRLIRLVRRDDVSARDLTERLSRDPTLVGEVVRLANSPQHRSGREITSLQEAVIALGQRGLTQIVITAAMRPIFNAHHGRFSRIAGTRLWDVSERCSHACVFLRSDATNPFHAHLAGMVANIGWVAALRVLDTDYQDRLPPCSDEFYDVLSNAVARLSEQIARQWDFPANVCDAVRERAVCSSDAAVSDLTRALHAADRVSKLHVLVRGQAGAELMGLDFLERRGYDELQRVFSD